MSYILDAIAKSEAERQQQQMPRAEGLALPAQTASKSRRLWLSLIVGALLLNALLLTVWIRGGTSPAETRAANEAGVAGLNSVDSVSKPDIGASSGPAAVTGMQSDRAGADIGGAATASAATGQRQNESMFASIAQAEAPSAGQLKPKANELAPLPAPPAVETLEAGEPGARRVDGEEPGVAGDAAEEGWRHIEPDSLSAAIGAARLPVAKPETSTGENLFYQTSRLSDLPETVRKDLPTVTFSGHLYSSNPRSRLVFVGDGRPVVAGQRIADNLFLHEITPSGVVVRFRDYLIEVGVLQNWTLN